VEDELNIARPIQFNLEQEGYKVRSTPSGKDALALHLREPFDLIILDLMLEEIDGFEVARQLRQRDARLPIIMLTARSAAEDRIQGLETGASAPRGTPPIIRSHAPWPSTGIRSTWKT